MRRRLVSLLVMIASMHQSLLHAESAGSAEETTTPQKPTLVMLPVSSDNSKTEAIDELIPVLDTLCAGFKEKQDTYRSIVRTDAGLDLRGQLSEASPSASRSPAGDLLRALQGTHDAQVLPDCDGQPVPLQPPYEIMLIRVTSAVAADRNVNVKHQRVSKDWTLQLLHDPLNVRVNMQDIATLGRCLGWYWWQQAGVSAEECKALGFPSLTSARVEPSVAQDELQVSTPKTEPPPTAASSDDPYPIRALLAAARVEIPLDSQPGVAPGLLLAYSQRLLAQALYLQLRGTAHVAAHAQLYGAGIGGQLLLHPSLAFGASLEFASAHLSDAAGSALALHPLVELQWQPLGKYLCLWLMLGHYWFFGRTLNLDTRFYSVGLGVGARFLP